MIANERIFSSWNEAERDQLLTPSPEAHELAIIAATPVATFVRSGSPVILSGRLPSVFHHIPLSICGPADFGRRLAPD